MNRIINLQPEHYYKQDNNPTVFGHKGHVLRASSQCLPTARVMYYIGNGVEYSNPSNLPDDAYFAKKLVSDAAFEIAQKKYPTISALGYPPNEIHGMYHSFLDHEVVGRRVSDFRTNLTFDDYVDRMKSGEIVMTSGEFTEAGYDGHAFDVIGVIIPNTGAPALILADPKGDYRTLYTRGSGYAVVMSKTDFLMHAKPVGAKKKWGHVKI